MLRNIQVNGLEGMKLAVIEIQIPHRDFGFMRSGGWVWHGFVIQ
jgi:hypothetical protein